MSTLQFIDDITRRLGEALPPGAERIREEIEERLRAVLQRTLADADFVTREEFDAVRAMAQKAREENEALKARLDALEARDGA